MSSTSSIYLGLSRIWWKIKLHKKQYIHPCKGEGQGLMGPKTKGLVNLFPNLIKSLPQMVKFCAQQDSEHNYLLFKWNLKK